MEKKMVLCSTNVSNDVLLFAFVSRIGELLTRSSDIKMQLYGQSYIFKLYFVKGAECYLIPVWHMTHGH